MDKGVGADQKKNRAAKGAADRTANEAAGRAAKEYTDYPGDSWLLRVSELYSRRAPGNTCLQALYSEEEGSVEHPINNSKGCGGVMRVAPAGLFFEPDDATRQAAGLAALTHGHPLGYISAAALAYIVSRCAREIPVRTADVLAKLVAIVDDCCARLCAWFPDHPSAAAGSARKRSSSPCTLALGTPRTSLWR